jgi:hypothetical protein
MTSKGTPKIPRFKIIVSLCESLFHLLFFSRISEKNENSHHAKIVNRHLVNFYRWSENITLSNHFKKNWLLGQVIKTDGNWKMLSTNY